MVEAVGADLIRIKAHIVIYILPEGYVVMKAALYRQLIMGKLNMF